MGLDDKAKNKSDEIGGKAKEGAGRAVGNESLEAEGQGDQAEAKVKGGFEKAKDAVKDIKKGFSK